MKQLQVRCDLSELERVREAAQSFLGGLFDAIDQNRIVLSVDEALANVIEHGNCADDRALIDIEMERQADRVVFRILDRAALFDPTRAPRPDLETIAQREQEGGLGVFLYTTLMDAQHQARPGGGNVLTLSKRVPAR